VAETAGYERRGRSVTGEGRDRHRSRVSSQRRRERHRPVRLPGLTKTYGHLDHTRVWSTHQTCPGARIPTRKSDVPGVSLMSSSRFRASPGAISLSLGRDDHGRRTSCRPSVALPLPLRPGRLVAATACPGRHETSGTWLGRAGRPGGGDHQDDVDGPKSADIERFSAHQHGVEASGGAFGGRGSRTGGGTPHLGRPHRPEARRPISAPRHRAAGGHGTNQKDRSNRRLAGGVAGGT
jgi:hypothetical protein